MGRLYSVFVQSANFYLPIIPQGLLYLSVLDRGVRLYQRCSCTIDSTAIGYLAMPSVFPARYDQYHQSPYRHQV